MTLWWTNVNPEKKQLKLVEQRVEGMWKQRVKSEDPIELKLHKDRVSDTPACIV